MRRLPAHPRRRRGDPPRGGSPRPGGLRRPRRARSRPPSGPATPSSCRISPTGSPARPPATRTYVEQARRSMALAILMAGQRDDGSLRAGISSRARPRSPAPGRSPWRSATSNMTSATTQAATQAYEAAINEIRNVSIVPKAPPREVEEYLAKRAYQAKSLAPTYVSSRGFRGEPAGVIVPAFRNFTAVSVPVPIRFETDEATLTPDGEKAVDDLYAFFKAQGVRRSSSSAIPTNAGPTATTMRFRAARAKAVAEALQRPRPRLRASRRRASASASPSRRTTARDTPRRNSTPSTAGSSSRSWQ